VFGSTSLRQTALYIAGFTLAVAILGLATILATRAALTEQFDARIGSELAAVKIDYDAGGAHGLIDEINERKNTPGELSFGAQTAAGVPWTGPWPICIARRAGRPSACSWPTAPRPCAC
jgi:hypothetical protein